MLEKTDEWDWGSEHSLNVRYNWIGEPSKYWIVITFDKATGNAFMLQTSDTTSYLIVKNN